LVVPEILRGGKKVVEGWYDYGARYYDPTVAKFMDVDPLAGTLENIGHSSYHYDGIIRLDLLIRV